MRTARILMIAGLLAPQSVMAQEANPYSGFFSLPHCKAYAGVAQGRDIQAQNFCAGQLRALAYVSHVLPPDMQGCVPNGIPNAQLALVVVRYIEARPAQMQEDFMALALKAYRDAWPCLR